MRVYPNRYVQRTHGQIIAIALLYARMLQITVNPPYQDEAVGDNKTFAPPVYHLFMDAAYNVGGAVELIHPARFLFNAGNTPKQWNKEMLTDEHFKVLYYEQDASRVFQNTEIKGGVAVTYHDHYKEFGAIEIFTAYAGVHNAPDD